MTEGAKLFVNCSRRPVKFVNGNLVITNPSRFGPAPGGLDQFLAGSKLLRRGMHADRVDLRIVPLKSATSGGRVLDEDVNISDHFVTPHRDEDLLLRIVKHSLEKGLASGCA